MFRVVMRWALAAWTLVLVAGPVAVAWAGQAQPGQGEFVPISQLPPGDQLPAARLLIAAYAFVWVVLLVYLWSIWRRIEKVEADLRSLERRPGSAAR